MKSSEESPDVPTLELRHPIKAEQAGLGKFESVPTVDTESPIKYDPGKSEDVPSVDTSSELKIEGLTKNEDVPKHDLDASLKFDSQEEGDSEHGKFGKNGMVMIFGVLFAVVIVVGVILVYRLI
jgi:hypothetical protein